MTQEAGTLERLLLTAGEAVAELAQHLPPAAFADYIDRLGVRLPDGFITSVLGGGPLGEVQNAIDRVVPLLDLLRDAIGASDDVNEVAAVVAAGAALATEIVSVVAALGGAGSALSGAAPGLPDADARAALLDLAAELPRRILERLLLDKLAAAAPQAVALLALAGLADDSREGRAEERPKIPYLLRRLHLERVSKLASDPAAYLREVYGWGDPAFDGEELFRRLERLIQLGNGAVRRVGPLDGVPVDPPGLDVGWFVFQPDPSVNPPGLAASAGFAVEDDIAHEVELGTKGWVAYLNSTARFEAGLRASLATDGGLTVAATGGPTISAKAGLRLKRADQSPVTLLNLAGGTRLEARRVEASISFEGLNLDPVVQVETEGLTCVFDLGGSDSFLGALCGGEGGRGRPDITLGASWSPNKGLRFNGSAALEIAIPAHARIGPATLETIYLVARPESGRIPLEVSAAVRGDIGPFKATVDHVGVEFVATFPQDGGNLGPAQIDVHFKPPSGAGLSIDGGGFSGGGFLRLDPDAGEYAGALELQFAEVINVKAFGVVNTRLPEGGTGFSMAVVISAEFTPIQLSFGFTLVGVGGLIGVNRTVLYDPLRQGVRDGALNSILFPRDLAANAPRIIADLKRIFPPQNGRYLIGPMAKLGWGTPTIVSLELGLLLELPRPGFAILGVLRLALPSPNAPILNLQVNFLGVVDFEKKLLTFDASLFDSRLLTFTLTGDMAVRIYWGDNANFLLTAGGFHPDYQPPPMGLGPMNRMAMTIFQGNPTLRAEAYFAVTSNTVQFGAKVELKYGVSAFNVYGFVSLDALIQLSPFHFIVQISGAVAVRSGSTTLFSIRLEVTLEGPTPWHAKGRGSFEIGFIFTVTISAGFEASFGEARNTSLPPVAVQPRIEDALRADGAWRSLADPAATRQVALRELPPEAGVVIQPTGALAVVQKAAPLDIPLDRVGAQRVDGATTFRLVDVTLGGGTAPNRPVQEQFAAAQYLDMSDAERLSRRSFEPFDAGVEIAGAAGPRADFQRKVDVTYEVIYFRKPRRRLRFLLRDILVDLFVGAGATARSKASPSWKTPTGLGTGKVVLPKESFVVAGVDDLRPHGPDLVFSNESAAVVALKDLVRQDARLTGKLQVVPAYEAAA